MPKKVADLMVCCDCLHYLANGDIPDERPTLASDIERIWSPADRYTLVCGDSDRDDEFSRASCDCCGSTLGGSRHHAAALENDPTPVVFRAFREGGDVIALFPAMRESNGRINSYQHIGQHGAADYHGLIGVTRPASPAEYAELFAELESRGYWMTVRKRWTPPRGAGRYRERLARSKSARWKAALG